MQNNYKMQNIEAIFLILIVMINKLIINIPYYITDLVGTGAIINLIYIGIIGLIFVIILNYLFQKFPNSDIIDISEFLGGKFLKIIIGILFIIAFLFVSYVTLSDFSNLLKSIYFKNSPTLFIILFFIIGIIIANLVGFKSIIHTICVIVPFTIGSVLLALFAVYDDISIIKFSPFFGYNFKTTFIDGLLNLFSLYFIGYYYFLLPLLKNSYDYRKITLSSYIFSWIILFLTVLSISSVFSMNDNSEPLNSLYFLARKIELGNFLQRLDALFILLWLVSVFAYLSISIFMVNRTLQKVTCVENEKMFTFPISSIFLGLCLLPFNAHISSFLESTVYRYTIIVLIFILCFIILILANIKFKFRKGKFND